MTAFFVSSAVRSWFRFLLVEKSPQPIRLCSIASERRARVSNQENTVTLDRDDFYGDGPFMERNVSRKTACIIIAS